ncbi:hypothetical protein DITRI_Ditri03aG0024200 [Diplodiscus trichospermus]
MLLSPSLSPSPQDSPSTTSPPLLQPPPVFHPPLSAPVVSPPSPPTNTASPFVSPPSLTPPLPPVSTPAIPPPSLPVASPLPAFIVISPVTSPRPPTPPLLNSPPPPVPAATTIIPVASPPHPPAPALVIPSPPLPTALAPPPQPSKSLPSTSPLPSRTLPSVIPPPPATTAPSLPPPRPPIDPSSGSSQVPLSAPPPPPSLPLAVGKGGFPATKQGSHSPIGLVVASVGVGILLFVVFTLVCICCKCRRRKQKPSADYTKHQFWVTKEKVAQPGDHVIKVLPKALPTPQLDNAKGSGSSNSGTVTAHSNSSGFFTYDELVVATNGFSEFNLLGQGGFGYVHKGVLPSGREVAVKQSKDESHQGEREFQAEVETISRVHHKHLVSLVGYCTTGAKRLLVYEFVPNKTLEFHLHGNGQPVIVWENRLKIAIGSAKGIAYLHEDCSPTIIHRDIKAANILLDPQFEAKVSDFGLAKFFFDASSSITHIFTRVVGTFGYLAPEYASTGKLTDKSDVYSYGVMLLELITGHPPIIKKESSINQSLVDWARPLLARGLQDHDFDSLADPRLQAVYNKREMATMVTCAAACIRQSAWLRPRMIQVVRALEGDIKLAYIDERTTSWNGSMYMSSEISVQNTRHESMNKNNIALGSNNYGITGYSETTSEYDLNPSGSRSESHIINQGTDGKRYN